MKLNEMYGLINPSASLEGNTIKLNGDGIKMNSLEYVLSPQPSCGYKPTMMGLTLDSSSLLIDNLLFDVVCYA